MYYAFVRLSNSVVHNSRLLHSRKAAPTSGAQGIYLGEFALP